ICDSTGLVFGLMPHPEAIYAQWLHPHHTRDGAPIHGLGSMEGWEGEGLQLFRNAVEYVRSNR
ncbi:MAG TPA: phosphoribosylformylglycinamidine synthase subunit PurQ, partial [Poseidonia sp.]|nr:phosphoribosylformylglycinamidine synthase subunit PurQ [Poseidonia sp.]